MSDLMRYARELAEDIGPRPVNSEEEQQSANRIASWFAEGGLEPRIEEFECSTWSNLPVMISLFAMVVAAVASYPHGAVGVVMFIIALLALALFAYERFFQGRLADRRKTGLSQNVVVKYIPQRAAQLDRRRKIVIVTHYDSERTGLEFSRSIVDGYPVLQRANLICMIAIPVIMIIEFLPFVAPAVHWFWLLSCFAAILPLVSGISILLRKFVLPYSDGANNNASGVAAMMGVYENVVGGGTQANVPERVIRDAQTARKAGVVSDNVEVVYDADSERSDRRGSERNRNRKERAGNIKPLALLSNLRNRKSKAEAEAEPVAVSVREDNDDDELFTMPEEHRRPSRERDGEFKDSYAFDREFAPQDDERSSRRRERSRDVFSEYAARYADTELSDQFAPVTAEVVERDEAEALSKHDEKEFTPYQMTLGETQPYTPPEVAEATAEAAEAFEAAPVEDEVAEEPVAEYAYDYAEEQDVQRDAAAENRVVREEENMGTKMPPLRNGSTGDAAARHYEPIPAPARTFETPKPASSTPDWWQKAASSRDAARDEKEQEEIKAARSRYASVPTAERQRAEREALEAERRRAEEEKRAAEEAARIATEKRLAAEEAERAQAEMAAAEAAAAKAQETRSRMEVAKQPTMEQPAVQVDEAPEAPAAPANPYADLAPEDRPLWMRDEEKVERKPVNDGSLLAGIPDLDHRGDRRKAPSLIMDSDFGAAQPAPLAEGYTATPQRGFTEQFNAISSLPTTDGLEPTVAAEPIEPEDVTLAEGSGLFEGGTFAPGHTGAFVPVSGTGAFDAVEIDDADIIDDADDSDVAQAPMVGDFSAPASIDIPESRTRRFMDRMFHKDKDKGDEVSASEWLGVDEDFNARKAGKDIGSWDNFEDDDDWNGGAVGFDEDATGELEVEREVIHLAREDALDKEVWFVALGAHGSGNAGMKDFIDRHAKELRGSVIINLDCVGAGEICCLEQEGAYRSVQSDHRMQSLIGKIVPELSGNVEIESLKWADTDATVALRAGLRAITIMGFDRVAPVAYNTKGDTVDILEDSRLELTSELVTELVYKA